MSDKMPKIVWVDSVNLDYVSEEVIDGSETMYIKFSEHQAILSELNDYTDE